MKQDFNFYQPIIVRYRDLDPQGHVNNAVYLTYLESARLGYYQAVGIWQQEDAPKTGMVVAHNQIDYLAPIFLGERVQVGLRTDKMGRKSLRMTFQIEKGDGTVAARGKSVMVAYDNATERGILIPADWREKIDRFENQEK